MVPHLFGGIGLIAFGEIRLAGGDTGMIDYVVDLSSVVKYNWEGCLMTTSEILLLFQTIIALLALLVSVVHLMDDRKKDDSYGSKRKKHKKK